MGFVCDCCSIISSMKAVVNTTLVVQCGMGMTLTSWQSRRIWYWYWGGAICPSGGCICELTNWYLLIKLAMTTFSLRCARGLIMDLLTSRWFAGTWGTAERAIDCCWRQAKHLEDSVIYGLDRNGKRYGHRLMSLVFDIFLCRTSR